MSGAFDSDHESEYIFIDPIDQSSRIADSICWLLDSCRCQQSNMKQKDVALRPSETIMDDGALILAHAAMRIKNKALILNDLQLIVSGQSASA